ncbi:MAG: arylsulfatase [Verrucomicrobia bacterium]|nr:arylsulfatase [Verrucomicrobiota bacterium]
MPPFSSLVQRSLTLLAVLFTSGIAVSAERPNILLIMSDDMGFSDLGCYGGEIQTPNLDALAKDGIRFTQFYNASRCCPTRASLLTGLYPHQAGVGHMIRPVKNYPGYAGDLSREAVTIAEVLKAGGYRTYMSGKWHISKNHDPKQDTSNWPVQRGFEKFYGTIQGFGSFYDPASLCRQNTYITPVNDPEYKPEQFFYTDAINDNAVRFLQQDAGKDKPFFMYVAHTAAHWPLHALEKDLAKYKGKFDGGYDEIRQARVERLQKLGLMDPKWKTTPTIGEWDSVKRKNWESRCMEAYAAMIDNMDQGIGRIVDQLKKDGRFENTLILFLQDNGACAERMGRQGPHKVPENPKPMGPNELQTRPVPDQTRDGRPVRMGPGVMAGPADTYVGYGEAWANVANTPFREYKHWVHEGGISTPLIAHWPAGISARQRGKLEDQPGHLIDIMATCVDLSRVTYPKEFNGNKIKPMEGVSLDNAFKGRSLKRKNPLYWEHEGNRAIRDGKWKLVAMEDQPWELYDMEKDRTEMNNLAAREPKKVENLSREWDAWAERADVLPLGAYKPAYRTPGK